MSLNRLLRPSLRPRLFRSTGNKNSTSVCTLFPIYLRFPSLKLDLLTTSNTATVYVCHTCQNTYLQPIGRVTEKKSKNDKPLLNFHTNGGPPTDMKCDECRGNFQVRSNRLLYSLYTV